MSSRCKTKTEKAWLVAGMTAFVLHRLLEAEPDTGAMRLMEAVMIALSFPFGPIAMLFILKGVEGLSDYTNLSWLLDWSTLLFIGYIQWFWVLPEMRRNNETLTLNIRQPVDAVPADTASTSPAAAPVVFDAAAFAPRLAEFDEAGLTALGRVFQAQSPPRAPASPSHVEAIFPRVS